MEAWDDYIKLQGWLECGEGRLHVEDLYQMFKERFVREQGSGDGSGQSGDGQDNSHAESGDGSSHGRQHGIRDRQQRCALQADDEPAPGAAGDAAFRGFQLHQHGDIAMAQRPDSFQDRTGPGLGTEDRAGFGVPTPADLHRPFYRPESEIERKPGIKLDEGKPKHFQNVRVQFYRALEALAHHAEKGNAEPGHTPGGWKEVKDGYLRYTEALERHLHEEAMLLGSFPGVTTRSRQIEHATAVLWNAAARLEHLFADTEE